jgi:hypothetical protein
VHRVNAGQGRKIMTRDAESRTRIEEHWQASELGDTDREHAIYTADAILDYPQSGERFRGRSRIQEQRGGHPAERHFTIVRILGSGDLWVSECVITYDGVPTNTVSIMEFADNLVTHETQYFADPFPAPRSRASLAEPISDNAERSMLRRAIGSSPQLLAWLRRRVCQTSGSGSYSVVTVRFGRSRRVVPG